MDVGGRNAARVDAEGKQVRAQQMQRIGPRKSVVHPLTHTQTDTHTQM